MSGRDHKAIQSEAEDLLLMGHAARCARRRRAQDDAPLVVPQADLQAPQCKPEAHGALRKGCARPLRGAWAVSSAVWGVSDVDVQGGAPAHCVYSHATCKGAYLPLTQQLISISMCAVQALPCIILVGAAFSGTVEWQLHSKAHGKVISTCAAGCTLLQHTLPSPACSTHGPTLQQQLRRLLPSR